MSDTNNSIILQRLMINFIGQAPSCNLTLLFKQIADYDGNIISSKISQLESYYSGSLTIEGRWDCILRVEQALESLSQDSDLQLITQRIKNDTDNEIDDKLQDNRTYIPYKISINNLDDPGLLEKISAFFELQEITIIDLNANSYTSEYDSEIIQIDIKIKVPSDIHIASLREQFDLLCYNENLDACLMPIKK